MQSPRILLIDDNPGDRALMIRAIRRELPDAQIQEILERFSLKQAIKDKKFDVVVTDFQIRWTTGLDVLIDVKDRDPNIPVIMFTNTGTEEIAVEAMKLGLDDYILKNPSHYGLLPGAIVRSLERANAQQRTEMRFQSLNQSLQTIQQLSLGLLQGDAAASPETYQVLYETAHTAHQVVQELMSQQLAQNSDRSQT